MAAKHSGLALWLQQAMVGNAVFRGKRPTAAALAKLSKISRQTITGIIGGDTASEDTIATLAAVLKVNLPGVDMVAAEGQATPLELVRRALATLGQAERDLAAAQDASAAAAIVAAAKAGRGQLQKPIAKASKKAANQAE